VNRDIRNRIVEMRDVPAAELLDNRRNWRRHPAAQRDALRGILAEVGIADTLVAYRSEREGGRLTLIDGHLRKADHNVVWPTLILDVSDAEADLLLASLDPLAAMAEADAAALSALLADVAPSDAALRAMLDGLARDNPLAEPDTREDHPEVISRADELQAKWNVRRGDVWLLGKHRVMCGDSTDADDVARLMQGEKATAIITDPPYNVEFGRYDGEYKGKDAKSPSEYGEWLWGAIELAERLLMPGSFCFVWQGMLNCRYFAEWFPRDWRLFAGIRGMTQFLPTPAQFSWDPVVFWITLGKCPIEPIAGRRDYFISNTATWLQADGPIKGGHPCPRPLDAVCYVVGEFTQSGQTIIDPFLGSGTTLIAAEKLGRICYGMEIHPPYCAVVLQRWLDFTGNSPRLADA